MIKKIKNIIPFKIKQFLRNCINGHYSYFLSLFPITNNKIVICNYFGKGYGDNGKYIAEEIIRQGLDVDIVWLLRKELIGKSDFPSEIRVVKYGSLKGLYELATAKIWIDNCRKVFHPIKRKNQYYIQIWHSSISMKRVEKDVEDSLSKSYVICAKKDSEMADLFISNGKFNSNLYRNSFWYNEEILESGSPRNDIMFDKSNLLNQKVKKFFNINNDIKIVLYAPTFRKVGDTKVYDLDYDGCISALHKKFGGKWVLLVRLHPNISYKSNEIRYSENIYNASSYDDMQELLVSTDILITDYSSSMFEFSLRKSPCFLYVPDVKEYMKDRNFYFTLNELPFSIGEDNSKLIEAILNFDEHTYIDKLDKFFKLQGVVDDGFASERVVKKIKDVIG